MTSSHKQSADTDTLLQISNINKSFGGRQILHNIDLLVSRGKILTLIGPNGAGKTTLVRIVLGLLQADAGTIVKAPSLSIGYMPQKLQIDSTMPITVAGFLRLARGATARSIIETLELLQIGHISEHQLRAISGGELQRVLLARALLRQPALLILDEPAQGVDVGGQAELYQLISALSNKHNCGVLMISHDLHLVMSATDEVVCLNHHICCHGKPEQVSNDPAYLDLFGKSAAKNLAVYTHHHNHSHDIDGNIVHEHHE